VTVPPAVSEPDGAAPVAVCEETTREVPLTEETGSAGIMYNLAEHPKSIRAVAARLLTEALDAREAGGGETCAAGCTAGKRPEIVYRVAPRAFLPEPTQQPRCLTLERATRARPLAFPDQEFETVEELNAFVMEFSQGRGALGKQLYAQCDGNCSPRYTFRIAPGDGRLKVETRVICGLARDRNSEDYSISTAMLQRCAVDATPIASSRDQR
jgi:hypothetical protein